MGVNSHCVQPLCLPVWEGDNCTICILVRVFGSGVSMHGIAIVEALWRPIGSY